MKTALRTVVVGAGVLLSATAWACPNLAGNFTCNDFDTGAVQDVTITQVEEDGAQKYSILIVSEGESQTRIYHANNMEVPVDNDGFVELTERAFCEEGELKVQMNGELAETGDILDAVVTVGVTESGDLYDSYIGSIGDREINFSEECPRVD